MFKYTTCSLSSEKRNLIAELYVASQELEYPRGLFQHTLRQAGYDIPAPTLSTWKAMLSKREEAISSSKATGAERMLTEAEERIFVGRVLYMNTANVVVYRENTQDYIRERFGKEMDLSTVSRYMHRNGFSVKTLQSKAKGFTLEFSELAEVYFKWIEVMRPTVFSNPLVCFLASIDFVTTRHSSMVKRGYGPVSGCVI